MAFVLATAQPKILLVGAGIAWTRAMTEAASASGHCLDIEPGMDGAIARLLPRMPPYRHVLAQGGLGQHCLDVLAGLLDEGEQETASLIVLGGEPGPCGVTNRVLHPDAADLACALAAPAAYRPSAAVTPLPGALRAATLRMRFQPIVAASDLAPLGFEALARLHHPDLGILHPRDFVPNALASGQEHRLSTVTVARTMLNLPRLRLRPGLFVSINLPLTTVMHPDALPRAQRRCTLMGINPTGIVIELLETPDPPDYRALAAALAGWRHAGFRIAIDDAGPALPHWREMLRLPAEFLKLDGAMVADPEQHDLAAEIVAAAHEHGLFVIAEGIADAETLTRMRALGVDALQGFLICRPLPSMAVPVWLRQGEALHAESGSAMLSSDLRSASTPSQISTPAATTISTAAAR